MLKTLFPIVSLCLAFSVFALDAAKEYEIKAAFLFNLGAFVHWPDSTFANANAPFYICVLGEDPFGERLDVVAAGQKVSGHPVAIRRAQAVADTAECDMLFVSTSVQAQLPGILAHLKNQPVLTVGDMDNFAVQGGMVQFYPRDNKIRLMLAPEAFSNAGLQPSAHLMRIAQIVSSK